MSSQLKLLTEDKMTAIPAELQPEHGEVFTRRWVVEFILDAVGYLPHRDLAGAYIVEPSCGSGAFVVPIIERLLESAALHDRDFSELRTAVLAVDLLPHNVEFARQSACLLYTSPSPRDQRGSRMPSSA